MAVNLDEERGGVKRAELIPCGNTIVSGDHNVCQNPSFLRTPAKPTPSEGLTRKKVAGADFTKTQSSVFRNQCQELLPSTDSANGLSERPQLSPQG